MNTKSSLLLALDRAIAELTEARLILDAPEPPADIPQGDVYEPTARERRILDLAEQGFSRSDIAADLGLSVPRVAQLVANLRRLGVEVPTPRVNPLRATAVASATARVERLKIQLSLLEVWESPGEVSEEFRDTQTELAQAQDTLARMMDKYR